MRSSVDGDKLYLMPETDFEASWLQSKIKDLGLDQSVVSVPVYLAAGKGPAGEWVAMLSFDFSTLPQEESEE